MAQKLTGKEVRAALGQGITAQLALSPVTPTLATLRLGEDPSDLAYESSAKKSLEALGLALCPQVLPREASLETLIQTLTALGQDPEIHGILLFQPLPPHLSGHLDQIRQAIPPQKDIDCGSSHNLGLLLTQEPQFLPCTPGGVMALLQHYQIPLLGKKVTLIGRSLVVGRPLALLLIQAGATLTLCHSASKDLAGEARNSEILVSATGKPGLITPDFVHPQQIVIDVGTTMVEGKLCGDLSPEAAALVQAYTPTPGGTGGVTTLILARQLVQAALQQQGIL